MIPTPWNQIPSVFGVEYKNLNNLSIFKTTALGCVRPKYGSKVRVASILSTCRPPDSNAGLNPGFLSLTGKGVRTCLFYNFTVNQLVSDEFVLEH